MYEERRCAGGLVLGTVCFTESIYEARSSRQNRIRSAIDTGSGASLMHADAYISMGSPRLRETKFRFSGVGLGEMTALGEFDAELTVDGHSYPILIRIVSDALLRPTLLIGTDFLDAVEVNARRGTVTINPIDKQTADTNDSAEIFQVDIEGIRDADEIDVVCVRDVKYKSAVAALVENYEPKQMYETDIKMTIVLSDDKPVYQRARRLSPMERNIVNSQIEEWEQQGIVRSSSSDYASPVVLVKKKDDSYRLCVDYRLLNRKIIRDRYPLPLIEDQLDKLQNAKIFSTIDLKNGFFHVRMDESSVKYTSFIVPDGQYEFLRVPFGLCNSPSVFQRYVTHFLKI